MDDPTKLGDAEFLYFVADALSSSIQELRHSDELTRLRMEYSAMRLRAMAYLVDRYKLDLHTAPQA